MGPRQWTMCRWVFVFHCSINMTYLYNKTHCSDYKILVFFLSREHFLKKSDLHFSINYTFELLYYFKKDVVHKLNSVKILISAIIKSIFAKGKWISKRKNHFSFSLKCFAIKKLFLYYCQMLALRNEVLWGVNFGGSLIWTIQNKTG